MPRYQCNSNLSDWLCQLPYGIDFDQLLNFQYRLLLLARCPNFRIHCERLFQFKDNNSLGLWPIKRMASSGGILRCIHRYVHHLFAHHPMLCNSAHMDLHCDCLYRVGINWDIIYPGGQRNKYKCKTIRDDNINFELRYSSHCGNSAHCHRSSLPVISYLP